MNYSEMTDAELDRLSADICGFVWKDKLHVDNTNGEAVVDGSEWHPAHLSSNQAERHLLPKFSPLGIAISVNIWARRVEMYGQKLGGETLYTYWSDDKINRAKVIAALTAWEKLK